MHFGRGLGEAQAARHGVEAAQRGDRWIEIHGLVISMQTPKYIIANQGLTRTFGMRFARRIAVIQTAHQIDHRFI
ncbi:hypothetical protein D3C78_1873830 [compost metagenome]